jgi:transposase InsO family protein
MARGWVNWFNTERLHGSIDRLCPVEFETRWHAAQQTITDDAACRPPVRLR